eukprot:365208-Chlamydomonas_euryale.AAC.12
MAACLRGPPGALAGLRAVRARRPPRWCSAAGRSTLRTHRASLRMDVRWHFSEGDLLSRRHRCTHGDG